MVLVKILKINWGLDFLWSKIYDKGMVKERQGKCVMILYHNPLCVIACTGTQNRIKEQSMLYYIGIDRSEAAFDGRKRENRKSYLKGVSAVLPASGLVAAKPGRLVQAVHGRAL